MLPTELGMSSTTLISPLTHAQDQKRLFMESLEYSLMYNKHPLNVSYTKVLGYRYIALFPLSQRNDQEVTVS